MWVSGEEQHVRGPTAGLFEKLQVEVRFDYVELEASKDEAEEEAGTTSEGLEKPQ